MKFKYRWLSPYERSVLFEAIYREAIGDAFDPHNLDLDVFICEADDETEEVLGFMAGYQMGTGEFYIKHMGYMPNLRGTGSFGRYAMEFTKEAMRLMGFMFYRTCNHQVDTNAQRMLLKIGFLIHGVHVDTGNSIWVDWIYSMEENRHG